MRGGVFLRLRCANGCFLEGFCVGSEFFEVDFEKIVFRRVLAMLRCAGRGFLEVEMRERLFS